MSTYNLRRSARIQSSSRENPATDTPSYPDGLPTTPFERFVAHLNNETFPAPRYSRIDDVLVYSLFVPKKHFGYYRRLQASPAFTPCEPTTNSEPRQPNLDSCPSFTNDDAKELHRLYNTSLPDSQMACEEAVKTAAKLIRSSMTHIFAPDDLRALTQCVTPALSLCPSAV